MILSVYLETKFAANLTDNMQKPKYQYVIQIVILHIL